MVEGAGRVSEAETSTFPSLPPLVLPASLPFSENVKDADTSLLPTLSPLLLTAGGCGVVEIVVEGAATSPPVFMIGRVVEVAKRAPSVPSAGLLVMVLAGG